MTISSLKNQKEFDLVNKQGVKLHSNYFILVVAKNFLKISANKPIEIFLGMKVSKKSGNAVIRNKIKRRIRHLIQIISKQFAISQLAIIFVPKRNFAQIEFAVLRSDLEKLITSIL